MKQFLSAGDTPDVNALIQSGLLYKSSPRRDSDLGQDKRMGLLFLNPSLRTRLSTQVAANNLGLDVVVFNVGQEGWALEFADGAIMNGTTVEHIKDAAPILGQYFNILGVRTFPGLTNREADYSEHVIKQFVRYSGVPVVSLESATLHPLQSLADLITMTEVFREKRRPKVVLTWAPHVKALPQCVANSFAQWVNAWDQADFIITHPEGYELDPQFVGKSTVMLDQDKALAGADFVYVKNWSSFKSYGEILPTPPSWMLTLKKLSVTRNARVMHCLPVRRNVELSDEILDSPASLVTQQAGNRVWAAQAVLSEILKSLNSK